LASRYNHPVERRRPSLPRFKSERLLGGAFNGQSGNFRLRVPAFALPAQVRFESVLAQVREASLALAVEVAASAPPLCSGLLRFFLILLLFQLALKLFNLVSVQPLVARVPPLQFFGVLLLLLDLAL